LLPALDIRHKTINTTDVNNGHTSHEEEVRDNRRKTKKPPLPTARITTTLIDWQATKIEGPPKNHHEDILTFFLHTRPLFYG
jgi:hypothetical protein